MRCLYRDKGIKSPLLVELSQAICHLLDIAHLFLVWLHQHRWGRKCLGCEAPKTPERLEGWGRKLWEAIHLFLKSYILPFLQKHMCGGLERGCGNGSFRVKSTSNLPSSTEAPHIIYSSWLLPLPGLPHPWDHPPSPFPQPRKKLGQRGGGLLSAAACVDLAHLPLMRAHLMAYLQQQ